MKSPFRKAGFVLYWMKSQCEGGVGMEYTEINAGTIDRWVDEGWEWGQPISHEEYEKARSGEWDVKLTPVKYVPHEWFGRLKGKKLLGLASGGGQQMPIFTALGAECIVLDYSERMLEQDRLVAAREGYDIGIVRADMTKKLPFEDDSFDIIFHPVSNCYIEDVKHVWKECHRVLKKGGVLLAGFGLDLIYAFDDDETEIINVLPFNPLKNEQHKRQLMEADCGMQFSHTLSEQIGGQMEAGLTLTHLYDDTSGAGRLHEHNITTYAATRSVK